MGDFSHTTPSANIIRDPPHYRGDVVKVWDPIHPSDFVSMETFTGGDGLYWGADLGVKAVFDNGSEQYALIKEAVRSNGPFEF